jgi:hypothetical protein
VVRARRAGRARSRLNRRRKSRHQPSPPAARRDQPDGDRAEDGQSGRPVRQLKVAA